MSASSTHVDAQVGAPDQGDRITPDLLKLAGVVIVGTFVVQLDATMVNVALDTLLRRFGTTVSAIQWVSTAYLLSLALVIPAAGWAVDRFGAKRTWLAALTVFLVGSVLCSLAWSVGSLITFRVVQGVGGGMLLPLSQTMLAQAAGERRLGRLMGVIGVPLLLGPILGPVIGGVLVQYLSWRWIFEINVPVCLIAILLSLRVLPPSRPSGRPRLDLIGLALLSPGLAGLIYGLAQASKDGFISPRAVVPVAVSIALLVGFVTRARRTGDETIIDLRLFRSRDFTAASAMLFFAIISMLGTMLLLPLYYQIVRGDTVLHAGLLLAPQGMGAAVGIAVCGKLTDRFSPRPIAVTGVLMTAGGLFTYTQVRPDTSILMLSLALVVVGAGFGAILVPATAAAYRGLAPEAIPRATVSIRIVQQVGSSFGVAVLAIVLQTELLLAVKSLVTSGGLVSTLISAAFAHTLWVAVGFSVLALPPALLLSDSRMKAAGETALVSAVDL